MSPELSPQLLAAVIGAVATIIVGTLATWYTRRGIQIQLEHLQLAKEKAERESLQYRMESERAEQAHLQEKIERERAEREREEAKLQRDEYRRTAEVYARQFEVAPTQFTRVIGEHIDAAAKALRQHGPDSMALRAEAHALVKVRNDLLSSLESIKIRLNSYIDQLDGALAARPYDVDGIERIVEVLQRSWSAKAIEISIAVRKMLVDMGLEQVRL